MVLFGQIYGWVVWYYLVRYMGGRYGIIWSDIWVGVWYYLVRYMGGWYGIIWILYLMLLTVFPDKIIELCNNLYLIMKQPVFNYETTCI